MNNDDAKQFCERLSQMRSERSTFDQHWEEVSERVWPAMVGSFNAGVNNNGDKNTVKIYDSSASLALIRFSAVLQSMLNPSNQKWHSLRPTNTDLLKDRETAMWYDEVRDILFKRRYNPLSNFATASRKIFKSEGAYGNGCLFCEFKGGLMRYQTFPLSKCYIMEDIFGNVSGVFRVFEWSLQKIKDRFGDDVMPTKWQEELKKNPKAEKEILHVCVPRTDVDASRVDYKGMAYASAYIGTEHADFLEEGGYHSFPYVFSRYDQSAGELYGRGPAMSVLPDIKMVNAMSKTTIRAHHRNAEPAILAHDDGVLGTGRRKIDMRPNKINYGGVDENGRPLIQAFNSGSRVESTDDLLRERRSMVNDAFLITLFQILVDTPEMSATEAMLRAQEKGMLITPEIETQRGEYHAPLIGREIDVLMRAGVFPDRTPAMIEAGVDDYEIVYASPFDRLQDSEEVVGIQRTFEMVLPLAQYDETVLEHFDYGNITRRVSQINGVPENFMKPLSEVAAAQQRKQDQEEAMVASAGVGEAAGAMKDIAQAQKLASDATALS